MSLALPATREAADPFTVRTDRLIDVAHVLRAMLVAARPISRRRLTALMSERFGGSDADGIWAMRDAYDALETAQVLALAGDPDGLHLPAEPGAILDRLQAILDLVPTQTYRSERQIDLQQFSTPLPLAWLMGHALRLTPRDILLEPSAGTGLLAVHGRSAGARLILNERDPARAALLSRAFGQAVSGLDGEHIDSPFSGSELCGAERPSAILINPPFSRSEMRGADRHAAARHLRSALLALAPGGRAIAVMPAGFARHGACAAAYQAVGEVARPRVDILVGGSAFARHGTSIDVRLLVFDKGWTGAVSPHAVTSLVDLLPIVSDLPPRGAIPAPAPISSATSHPTSRIAKSTARGRLLKLPAIRLVAPQRQSASPDQTQVLDYVVRDAPRPAAEPVGVYVPWRLARIDIKAATPHPDALVESLAMASVLPPAPHYRPMLPSRAVGALSDAQLEAVILAGNAFARDLPGRFVTNIAGDRLQPDPAGHVYRTGFFIGDGTGVGKGRTAAGCIMDQWCQGRRKAIWVSKSAALLEDARRDWAALGGLPIDIQSLDSIPLDGAVAMPAGILFLTYATLRSQRHDTASRLQQILAWLGPDHDGMIVFDEAHAMANAAGTESDFGAARGSEQGLAGVRLQNALPRARILYISATGATDPANLCYASRLGLWGQGTAFADREAFLAAMDEGGIAAMEIVARDLKAMGLYVARALSFAGVEYDALEHRLTPGQIEIYDSYADAWAIIHANLAEVLKASSIVDRMTGAVLNGQALGSALSRFESAKQRFFSQLLIGLKIPTLITAIEQEIAAGHSAVVQLVTTGEAVLDRRLSNLSPADRAALDIDVSPRDNLIDYLRTGFPVRQMRTFRDSGGQLRSEPMIDGEGDPVVRGEALAARDELIEQLCGLPPIASALDALLRHFGTDAVAEVTGRGQRLIVDADGRQKIERRGVHANLAETDRFMAGRKRILIFSDAGGTGRSYHADRGCRSAARRRIHFLLEPGWRAAAAIQGLGRTHRTNQTMPPIFRPVTTDCRGERRFISTIARRLDSLGALTRGQRQTGSQNLFDPADNLESEYAREALAAWYQLLHAGKLASVSMARFVEMTGLRLIDAQSGALLDQLPPIQRWLNRLLALRIETQNAIFTEYSGLIEARIDAAREAGRLDVGVETIVAERIEILSDQRLCRDDVTGAETRLLRLELHRRRHPLRFARVTALWGAGDDRRLYRNARSGRVAFCLPSWSITDDEGRPMPMFQLVRPTDSSRISAEALAMTRWQPIGESEFERLWEAEVRDAEDRMDVDTVTIATGLLLPVWGKLPTDDVRVWRISHAGGEDILGRIVPMRALAALAKLFGLDGELVLTPDDYLAAAASANGVALPNLGDARLLTVLVNGERRLEIRDYPANRRDALKASGCFTEIIAYRTRLFVPVARAREIVASAIAASGFAQG